MRIPISLLALLAFAAFATGCGGPNDPDKRLAEACDRQVKEVESAADEGDTPTAKSTKDRLEDVTLVECSGQHVKLSDGDAAAKEGDSGEGASTMGSETMPAGGEAAALDPKARELFATTCGGCHTLSDAGTNGAVGPNLDETEMDAEAVRAQIKNGAGAMPAGLLEGEEADSVAKYVADAAAAASK